MKIDFHDDALVRTFADRPHLLEQALADLVIEVTHPDDLSDEIDIAAAVEGEIFSFDERDDGDEEEYGSAIEELYEGGIVCIDAVVEIVQHMLEGDAE